MSKFFQWQLRLFISFFTLIYLFSFGLANAQTPCGNITGPDNLINQSNIITVPISDCADPFKVTFDPASPYTLKFNGVVVENGGSIALTEINTNDILIEGEPHLSTYYTAFFKHEGGNYVFVDTGSVIGEGTYTLVIKEYELTLSQHSWLEHLKQLIVPVAYAESFLGPYTYAITFTITKPMPEPAGASSVLFLPGIQASRLYTQGVLGTEDQLWEPNVNNDVSSLAMTETGASINNIYTRDVIDEINVSPLFQSNIYKSFFDMLDDLVEDEVIKSFNPFAYDWRYDVKDIVYSGTFYETGIKSLIDEVESLAEDSFTGKVTIIGHSNGGLMAKVLITELERLGKEDLVDKVVFVGTPQLGTPKAIGVMLHGLEQQKALGLIIDDMTTRNILKNMPGAYGLLPSQKYFDMSGDILVTTDGSSSTAKVAQYGDIDSLDKLTAFVLDTNNVRDDDVSINTPSTLNPDIMDSYITSRNSLDEWRAPNNIEVYEVVGTGLLTIKGFEYKEFPCINLICAFGSYAKPYPLFTNSGDQTVVELSAAAYQGEKVKGVVDLEREGAQLTVTSRSHAEMTESPTVQNFIDSIIRFPYLNETLEIPQDYIESTTYTVIGAHSPVQLTVETDNGKKIGRFDGILLEQVSGAQYFELGGSSYIVIPKTNKYEVTVKGTGVGVYSLTIDTVSDADVQSRAYTYLGASTSPQMTAKFSASSTGFSTIKTDQDGDGVIDVEQTLDGQVVVNSLYTYDTLISKIKLLQLSKIYKSVLLLQAQLAKFQFEKAKPKLEKVTLFSLEKTLILYREKRLITSGSFELLIKIINFLRK